MAYSPKGHGDGIGSIVCASRPRTLICWIVLATGLSAQAPVAVSASAFRGVIWKGVPAIVSASLIPDSVPNPTVTEGEIKLAVTGPGGEPAGWPFEVLERLALPLTLPPLHVATETHVLSAGQTADLPEGDYFLRASFNGIESRSVRVRVRPQPERWTIDDDIARVRLAARYQLFKGDAAAAIAILEEGTARITDDPWLLADLAESLEASEQNSRALATISAAVRLFRSRFPNATHPPRDLLQIQQRIFLRAVNAEGEPE